MITQKKIKELNFSDQIYFIPSYQRGYRWDEQQVRELLEDLMEVYDTKQERYCLQPIVVNTMEEGKKYEIIDGQQRLTTIFIILSRLSKFLDERFQLEFETRQGCSTFFENLSEAKFDYSNPDFAHISNAYQVVDNWFREIKEKKINSTIEINIFQTLMDQVEVIWYDVEQPGRKESIEIFTRLNSGKIPLTTAELLKALFLSKANFPESSHLKEQLDLSNKWNQIEYQLQNDDFWSFINKSENKTATRIEHLFRMVAENNGYEVKETDDVFSYYYPKYVNCIKEKSFTFVENNWSEIELYFTILLEWFHDEDFYHLIGLLIWDGLEINSIIVWYREKNKEDFKYRLFKEIDQRFCEVDLKTLTYENKSYQKTFSTLVFFNVMESYATKGRKFPFRKIKDEQIKWSLEHIHAQNADDVKQNEYKQWLEDHRNILINSSFGDGNENIISEIDDFLTELENKKPSDLKDRFAELSEAVLGVFSHEESKTNIAPHSGIEYEKLGQEHHIGNLALLDTRSNSSLGKSAFAIKRKSIIQMDLKGVYIPMATKNSFLKYYSDYPQHLQYWTLDDRDEYIGKMIHRVNLVKEEAKKRTDEQ